jgi:hypothetical protein
VSEAGSGRGVGDRPAGFGARRRFVQPRAGDTLASIAQREVADPSGPAAVELLLSWNLHLANRIVGSVDGLLGSDIVYVEPPPAS